MSKKCRWIIYCVLGVILTIMIAFATYFIVRFGVITPHFTLHGDAKVELALNESYLEDGFSVNYRFHDYDEEVTITSNLDETKVGEYKITYQVPSLNIKKTRKISVKDKTKPQIVLNGSKKVYTFVDNEYEDEGVKAVDNYDGDITNKVKVKNHVNIKKTGTYEVVYQVEDESGNKSELVRKVIVSKNPMSHVLSYQYDEYNNEAMQWWFTKSKNHRRETAAWDQKYIKKFASYYIGENEKVIYLTFDEGGSDHTYIKEIADVLNRYEIKGTFFLTRNYIVNEADFIRDLDASGHVVGNHTRNHLNMATLATNEGIKKFSEEVTSVEKAYMEVCGKEMKKVFRFPKGEASERTMKMVQDLGYRNFFWSHAYYDYGPQLSYQDAFDAMMKYYHNGAIYLIHPNNKGNYLAMEDFIKEMLNKGYTFKTVDQIK